VDFYRYANGSWIANHPIPADKSRWGAFIELQERNWFLIHQILDDSVKNYCKIQELVPNKIMEINRCG